MASPGPCGNNPSKFGGSNIFSSGQTGAQFFGVSSLPQDGRRLYVRLWAFVNGAWFSSPDNQAYRAGNGVPLTPTISPSSGTFVKKVWITLADATPCVEIRYTMNAATGSTAPPPPPDPTSTTGTVYTAPFKLTGKGWKVLKVKAFRASDNTASATATATVKIK
jgi:hypothetical protein